MSLEDAIRRARGKDLTGPELHSAIKKLNKIGNEIINGGDMKTFLKEVQYAEDSDILKVFKVDGVDIKLKAELFKRLLISDNKSDEYTTVVYNTTGGPRLSCNVKKLNDDILSVTVTPRCDYCHGSREIECDSCEGTGETECGECGNIEGCDECSGIGIVNCSYCEGDIFDEEDILFYEEININQGELF